jgi:hypothetical protein
MVQNGTHGTQGFISSVITRLVKTIFKITEQWFEKWSVLITVKILQHINKNGYAYN